MSEQKLNHEVKGMAWRTERQDCVETDLGKTTKKICCVECSQEHLASIILNGWSLELSVLFLDLASWQNWAIEGEGSWLERWSRHWWFTKVTKVKLLISKDTWNPDWNLQKYTQITLRIWKQKKYLVWWTSIPYSCLKETKHRLSPA